MRLRDTQYANINAVFREGGYYSISRGMLWTNCRCEDHLKSLRRNRFHKFYYITQGSCTIYANGVDYHGKAGRLFFIPAETSHIYESDTSHPFSQYWIHFDLTPYDTNPLSASTLPVYVDVPAESPIAQYFENICKLIGNHNLSDEMQLKATLFALLAEYIRLAVPESDST